MKKKILNVLSWMYSNIQLFSVVFLLFAIVLICIQRKEINKLKISLNKVESNLGSKIDGVEYNLSNEIDGVESSLSSKIDGVESTIRIWSN